MSMADQDGYDEALLLDTDGFAAAGSGGNVFLVKDGALYKPEIDNRRIGPGSRGPVTANLQKAFFDPVAGRNPKYAHWLTPV